MGRISRGRGRRVSRPDLLLPGCSPEVGHAGDHVGDAILHCLHGDIRIGNQSSQLI